MLPKNLEKYSVADIQKGYDTLKSENDKRQGPLTELLRQGKKLSEADERFIDGAGAMVDEFMVLEKVKGQGNVSEAAKNFTKDEKRALELLILKSEQEQSVDPSAAIACRFLLVHMCASST